ncbi:MAG: PEP-utilizing enzyme [Alistipes indistinctus]
MGCRRQKTILVRIETSPEDLKGMTLSEGILTARGGMTSHAAVVARGMGKCCVSGAGDLVIDYKNRTITVGTKTYKEGDWISLNGSTGVIYEGKVATKDAEVSGDFAKLMELADEFAHLKVRANADTPRDAKTAFRFGAQGIGLCRTEHIVLRGRPHQSRPRDDPRRRRGGTPQSAGQVAADAARRLRRAVRNDERPSGNGAPARPAPA